MIAASRFDDCMMAAARAVDQLPSEGSMLFTSDLGPLRLTVDAATSSFSVRNDVVCYGDYDTVLRCYTWEEFRPRAIGALLLLGHWQQAGGNAL